MNIKGIINNKNNKNKKYVLYISTTQVNVKRNFYGFVECVREDGEAFPFMIDEINIDLDGEFKNNIFYVKEFKLESESKDLSKKLLKYAIEILKSEDENFKIGPTGVKKIIEISNNDIIEFSHKKEALNILMEKTKIDPLYLELLLNKIIEITCTPIVENYLFKFGVSASSICKLIELYKHNSLNIIKKHPYEVGLKIGIPFEICDLISKQNKGTPFNKTRICYFIEDTLKSILNKEGSTYTTKTILLRTIEKRNKKTAWSEKIIPEEIIGLNLPTIDNIYLDIKEKLIKIYYKPYYISELKIAKNLKRLNTKNKKNINIEFNIEKEIEIIEKELKVKYSDNQKKCFNLLKSNGIKIITGGPGTGKTTIVNGILGIYKKLYPYNEILCLAPTGRAAQRMSEVTGMEANTIHKALNFVPFNNEFIVEKNNENPLSADLVVIDEMSMTDTEIFDLILAAIKDNATVILLGDENQLQSVSPGNILADIIKVGFFEIYRLTEVFRQKGDFTLINNANNVLNGVLEFELNDNFKLKQFKEFNEEVLTEIKKEFFDFDKNIQILSPIKIKELGTMNINNVISKEINKDVDTEFYDKETGERQSLTLFKNTYHLHDKIIFHRNNYNKGYFNGDIGEIIEIHNKRLLIKVKNEIIDIIGNDISDITLAYAITIHKSQGSESENILIVLPDNNLNFLNRNLLFTGLTRTKKYIKIIAIGNSLNACVNNIVKDKRKTGLKEKIRKVF